MKATTATAIKDAKTIRSDEKLKPPGTLGDNAIREISAALTALLADSFALYLKTKNFHWHVSGPNFYGYHLMFDEQAAQILAATDDMAERARKIGGTTLRSLQQAASMTRVEGNDADFVEPADMLAELVQDNRAFAAALKAVHELCDEHGDVATASLIEVWIDQTERRTWFLFEASRPAMTAGH